MREEEWRIIPGCNTYEVSNLGQVRKVQRRIRKLDHDKRGYKRTTLPRGDGGVRHVFVHRLVASAFIGDCPPSYQVNHKDGNISNNCVDNLEYVTAKDNHAHSWRVLGRKPPHQGEKTHFSKLTDTEVIQIRQLRKNGWTLQALAGRFGVKIANLSHLCRGQTWKHLL